MTMTRRFFLSSSCGAVISVAASSLLINNIFTNPKTAKQTVTAILSKRFPQLDIPENVLQQFTTMLSHLDVKQPGASGISLETAVDPNIRSINFDRYAVREFVMNTNYFERKNPSFSGLKFKPFVHQDIS